MSADYLRILDHILGVRMFVEFTSEGPEITNYAVILMVEGERRWRRFIEEIEGRYREMINGWERQ